MAQVDDFLMQHVAGGLEPGEQIMGLGLLRHPTRFNILLVPERYDSYLGVATDRRLIVFETEIGGIMTPTAKPIARNPIEWRYDELAEVTTKSVEGAVVHSGGAGTAMALIPHPYCGPFAKQQEPGEARGKGRRYDVFAHVDGLDGQRALFQQFPSWLQQRVAAGGFPMSAEKRAHIEHRIAEAQAAQAADQARRAQAAAERDAKLRAGWAKAKPYLIPGAIIAIGLGLAGTGAVFLEDGASDVGDHAQAAEHHEKRAAMLRSDLATWVDRPDLNPPPDCPEKSFPRLRYQEDLETCHLCRKGGDMRPGSRSFTREGSPWSCPPPAHYRDELREAESDLRMAEHDRDRETKDIILGAVLLVLALVLTPVGLLIHRKVTRKAAASGGAAGAPPPGASAVAAGGSPFGGQAPPGAQPGPSGSPGGGWPPGGQGGPASGQGGGWPQGGQGGPSSGQGGGWPQGGQGGPPSGQGGGWPQGGQGGGPPLGGHGGGSSQGGPGGGWPGG